MLGLVFFLLIALSGSQVPLTYLTQVQGYRPEQSQLSTREVALLQVPALAVAALLLDRPWIDARWIIATGLALILGACVMGSFINPDWNRDQFYLTHPFEAFGYAFLIMPILMLDTNVVKPEEGPYVSALFNTPRAVTEAIGVWMLQLITRWRGGLHRERLADTLGQVRAQVEAAPQVAALHVGPAPAGFEAAGRGAAGYGRLLMQQESVLTTSDTFVVLAVLTIILGLMLFIPGRELPPRIALAKH